MALLRSSLFVFVQGDTRIDAGPSGVLAGLRTWVDRAVDQRHAQMLISGDLLTGLSFTRDHQALTLLCSTALVNPDAESAEKLGAQAAELKARTDVSDDIKLQLYAMKLLELAGRGALVAGLIPLAAAHAAEGLQQLLSVIADSQHVTPADVDRLLRKTDREIPVMRLSPAA
jgi:hypothetical protein